MPRLGDLLAEIASGGRLSPSEIEQVRRQTNETYSLARRVNDLVDNTGNMGADVFVGTDNMSVLPHMCAGLATDSTQTLSSGSAVQTIPSFSTAPTTTIDQLIFNHGMNVSASNGSINISNVPSGSIWLISAEAQVLCTAGYSMGMSAKEAASSQLIALDGIGIPDVSIGMNMNGSILWRAETRELNWQLAFINTSTTTVELSWCFFQVARIR